MMFMAEELAKAGFLQVISYACGLNAVFFTQFSSLNCTLDTSHTTIMLFIYVAIINYKAVKPHFSQRWEK